MAVQRKYRREWQFQETFGCVCLGTVFVFAVQKNIIRHWVIVKTVFYTARPIKKLSLKHSFHETAFTCFFN